MVNIRKTTAMKQLNIHCKGVAHDVQDDHNNYVNYITKQLCKGLMI